MLPTVTHDIPSRRLTAVRSVTCARYAANSSNPDVNTLLPLAHGTCSTFTPRQRRHDTRHGAYRSHAGIRPHDRCRHWRTGCRSYRGARFPHVPHRARRHDGSTDTVNGPSAAISTCLTYICVYTLMNAHETRKSLAFSTASAQRDAARGPRQPLGPAQRACTAGAELRGGRWGNQPAFIPEPPAFALFVLSWRAGTPPSRPGRKAHICCLSGGTDGVSPEGPQRSEGRA